MPDRVRNRPTRHLSKVTSEFDRPILSARLAPVKGKDVAPSCGPAYAYHLTPRGLAAKARIARRSIEAKRQEYEMLMRQIAELEAEVGEAR